jgi:hypothetical protein
MSLPESVIYFPYIQVPQSAFITRLLLYWDEVATIVPDEWAFSAPAYRNRLLGDFASVLVDAGLVTMAVPTYELHAALTPFVQYLEELPEPEKSRRASDFKGGECVLVHRAKFVHEGLLPKLKELGFSCEATGEDIKASRFPESEPWMWLRVERSTTREFMTVLAAAAAEQVPGFQYMRIVKPGGYPESDEGLRKRRIPVTHRPESLLGLAEVEKRAEKVRFLERLQRVRGRLLDDIFPAPTSAPSAEWIVDFKQRFGDLLNEFRLAVEREVFNLAKSPENAAADDWGIDLASDELSEKIKRIEDLLADANIGKIEKVTFAVLKALPAIGKFFQAVDEIAKVVSEDSLGRPQPDARLAYGAFVRRELAAVAA